jgi:hypothetical protein
MMDGAMRWWWASRRCRTGEPGLLAEREWHTGGAGTPGPGHGEHERLLGADWKRGRHVPAGGEHTAGAGDLTFGDCDRRTEQCNRADLVLSSAEVVLTAMGNGNGTLQTPSPPRRM